MSEAIEEQIEALKQSIAALEAQRNTITDTVLSAALVPLQEKLAELEAQLRTMQHAGQRAVEQQRKQVTVLFMDFGASTQLVNRMDPEEAMEVFDSALNRLGKVVESHGGRVTRYTGDGLMAVFGTPVAREDDPQRAVLAGLRLVEEARHLGDELSIAGLAVRVGLNTGLVAVGGLTEAEDTLMGSAVNLASRLENAASIGSVLISHETYRHVRGEFVITENAPVVAKGFAEPVRAYLVQGTKARSFRQPLRGVEGLETHMVGREGELKCLQDALMNAFESGEGQVITVSGEAGVGKSRLLEEFQNWINLRPEEILIFQGRGRVEGLGQPFGLLREVFADRFEILEDDSPETVRQKFLGGLRQGFKEQEEMKAHLIGQMLGYDFKDSPHLKGVLGEGEQLRNRGMMYLGEYFLEMSHKRLVVMLMEDIHWADDSTLDAVNWLEERMSKLRMLIVCGARESLFERRPYWGEGEERHTRLNLKPLTKRESRELVEQILRHVTQMPESLRELVVENAEGNPFYLEELIKMLIEDGVIIKGETEWRVEQEELKVISVPSTLMGVLQARLDSLPIEERKVLQEASVVGRQFWDQVVAYVHAGGQPEAYAEILQERLSNLRGRELIFRREASAFAEAREYLFKHDLLREVTYESVLKKVRRVHHSLVADWLIANAGGRMSEYAGLIGEHLVLGGRGEEAVVYLVQAGEAALGAFSSREAERFYRRALELKPNEMQLAIILQGLGKALTNQNKREEAIQVLRQGIELNRQLGNQDTLAQMFFQLSRALGRMEFMDTSESWQVCQDGSKELLDAPDSPGLARLLSETGWAAFWANQPKEVSIGFCQRAIEMAQRLGLLEVQLNTKISMGYMVMDVDESIRVVEQTAVQAEAEGMLEIAARAYSTLAGWKSMKRNYLTGRQYRRKALDLYRKVGDFPMISYVLLRLVENYITMGDTQEVKGLVEEILEEVSMPELGVTEFQFYSTYVVYDYKGEWEQALELERLGLAEAHLRNDPPVIYIYNMDIMSTSLERAEVISHSDLSDAKDALRENLDIQHDNPYINKNPFLTFFSARLDILEGRLEEAHHSLDESEQSHDIYYENHKVGRDIAKYYLAQTEKRWDEALAIVQSLLDRFRESGARWYIARYQMGVGDALRGRDKPGDREQARQAYLQALDIFNEMGADGYVQVLQKRLETLLTEPS